MSVSPYRLLEFVVSTYDECEGPVTPVVAAERLDTRRALVDQRFETLEDCDLVRPLEDGYRPTVTGRELLALDIDDDVIIVDAQ